MSKADKISKGIEKVAIAGGIAAVALYFIGKRKKEKSQGASGIGAILHGSDNTLPTVSEYANLLSIAERKFKISREEARERYGSYTTGQWKKLLGISSIGELFSPKDRDAFNTYYRDDRGISVKQWYKYEFPEDPMGDELNGALRFSQLYILMKYGVPFYEVIGAGDSVVRERIFEKLSQIYKVPYDDIYYMWLNGEG